MDEKTFLQNLVAGVSCLQPLYEDHIRDHHELLTHVFMGAVASFVVQSASTANGEEVVRRLLEAIENGLSDHHAELNELIGVSFIENLMTETEVWRFCHLRSGPALKREMDAMLNWKAGG